MYQIIQNYPVKVSPGASFRPGSLRLGGVEGVGVSFPSLALIPALSVE